MRRYKERVPDEQAVIDAMVADGGIPSGDAIENDHIAFRTMGVAQLGVASLEAVLLCRDAGPPENVVCYATSNRRHRMPRDRIDNERSAAINPGEAVEEKVSLSDRFGLWLGFHKCSQDEYLDMVFGYCDHFGLKLSRETIEAEAAAWSCSLSWRLMALPNGFCPRPPVTCSLP